MGFPPLWCACAGDPGEVFHVLQAHYGPHLEGDGEGLPPAVLHLRRLPPLPRWGPFYCRRHQPDPLHRGLSPVKNLVPRLAR